MESLHLLIEGRMQYDRQSPSASPLPSLFLSNQIMKWCSPSNQTHPKRGRERETHNFYDIVICLDFFTVKFKFNCLFTANRQRHFPHRIRTPPSTQKNNGLNYYLVPNLLRKYILIPNFCFLAKSS